MDGPAVFRITVAEILGEHWSPWLYDMAITHRVGEAGERLTDLEGVVRDQAALRGLLDRIWNLHLRIVSVVEVSRGEDSHA